MLRQFCRREDFATSLPVLIRDQLEEFSDPPDVEDFYNMQYLDGLKELQETVEAPQVQYTGIFATSTSHRCLNFKGIEILRNRQVRFGDPTVGVRLCCPSAICKKGRSFHVHPFRRMVGVPAVSQRLVPTVSKVLKTVEQR